jgi:hypothetical protein
LTEGARDGADPFYKVVKRVFGLSPKTRNADMPFLLAGLQWRNLCTFRCTGVLYEGERRLLRLCAKQTREVVSLRRDYLFYSQPILHKGNFRVKCPGISESG